MQVNKLPAGNTIKHLVGWMMLLGDYNTTLTLPNFTTGTRGSFFGLVRNEAFTYVIDNKQVYLTVQQFGEDNAIGATTSGQSFMCSSSIHEIGKWSINQLLGETTTATGTLSTDGEAGTIAGNPQAGIQIKSKRVVFLPCYVANNGDVITHSSVTNTFGLEVPSAVLSSTLEPQTASDEVTYYDFEIKGMTDTAGTAPFRIGTINLTIA